MNKGDRGFGGGIPAFWALVVDPDELLYSIYPVMMNSNDWNLKRAELWNTNTKESWLMTSMTILCVFLTTSWQDDCQVYNGPCELPFIFKKTLIKMSQQEQHENRQLGGYKALVRDISLITYWPIARFTIRMWVVAFHRANDRSALKPKNTLLPYVP